MKTLLIYKSETGFTKAYADMIKARIPDLRVVDLKHFKRKMVKENDIIFYGGPLRNNVIVGLNKFLKTNDLFGDKDIFVFATGIQPIDDDKKENVINANGLEFYHVRLYLLPGGLDINKMKKWKQKIFRFAMKRAMNSNQMPEGVDRTLFESRINQRLDLVSPSAIDRMIEVYNAVRGKRLSGENI